MAKLILILLSLILHAYQCILAQSSGNEDVQINQRIFGGTNTKIKEIPWVVSIQYFNLTTGLFLHGCGGTSVQGLAQDHFVYTAAHCMDGVDMRNVRIRAGITDWTDDSSGQTREIKSFKVHPEYKRPANGNWALHDVAVIRLKSPLTLTSADTIKPLTLPKNGSWFSGNAIISGWGYTKPRTIQESKVHNVKDYYYPKTLRSAVVQILPLKQCNKVVKELAKSMNIRNMKPLTATNICTINRETNAGICNRDSGGPLLCLTNEGLYLCGIASFGFGCGQEKLPSVFVNVTKHLEWIYKAGLALLAGN